ncbi:hypothetical protein TNCV_1499551 [Trichonephila clavipes]|nr:hypothetical protein TNCV_1499551 [Trichonephila clavipes]
MKTRLLKIGQKLQEYASEVERLTNLAFSDHPETVREIISLQHFVDGLMDEEIQKAVRGDKPPYSNLGEERQTTSSQSRCEGDNHPHSNLDVRGDKSPPSNLGERRRQLFPGYLMHSNLGVFTMVTRIYHSPNAPHRAGGQAGCGHSNPGNGAAFPS